MNDYPCSVLIAGSSTIQLKVASKAEKREKTGELYGVWTRAKQGGNSTFTINRGQKEEESMEGVELKHKDAKREEGCNHRGSVIEPREMNTQEETYWPKEEEKTEKVMMEVQLIGGERSSVEDTKKEEKESEKAKEERKKGNTVGRYRKSKAEGRR